MEQELRRLAHGAHEQKKADQRQGVDMKAQELQGLADLVGRGGEYRVVLDRVEQGENREDAKREAEIADAIDDEGLYRCRVSRRLVIPEADQEIRALLCQFHREKEQGECECDHPEALNQNGNLVDELVPGCGLQVGLPARGDVLLVARILDQLEFHQKNSLANIDRIFFCISWEITNPKIVTKIATTRARNTISLL
jgi:hypothetical protein